METVSGFMPAGMHVPRDRRSKMRRPALRSAPEGKATIVCMRDWPDLPEFVNPEYLISH
jgi:hypothetical protein